MVPRPIVSDVDLVHFNPCSKIIVRENIFNRALRQLFYWSAVDRQIPLSIPRDFTLIITKNESIRSFISILKYLRVISKVVRIFTFYFMQQPTPIYIYHSSSEALVIYLNGYKLVVMKQSDSSFFVTSLAVL